MAVVGSLRVSKQFRVAGWDKGSVRNARRALTRVWRTIWGINAHIISSRTSGRASIARAGKEGGGRYRARQTHTGGHRSMHARRV